MPVLPLLLTLMTKKQQLNAHSLDDSDTMSPELSMKINIIRQQIKDQDYRDSLLNETSGLFDKNREREESSHFEAGNLIEELKRFKVKRERSERRGSYGADDVVVLPQPAAAANNSKNQTKRNQEPQTTVNWNALFQNGTLNIDPATSNNKPLSIKQRDEILNANKTKASLTNHIGSSINKWRRKTSGDSDGAGSISGVEVSTGGKMGKVVKECMVSPTFEKRERKERKVSISESVTVRGGTLRKRGSKGKEMSDSVVLPSLSSNNASGMKKKATTKKKKMKKLDLVTNKSTKVKSSTPFKYPLRTKNNKASSISSSISITSSPSSLSESELDVDFDASRIPLLSSQAQAESPYLSHPYQFNESLSPVKNRRKVSELKSSSKNTYANTNNDTRTTLNLLTSTLQTLTRQIKSLSSRLNADVNGYNANRSRYGYDSDGEFVNDENVMLLDVLNDVNDAIVRVRRYLSSNVDNASVDILGYAIEWQREIEGVIDTLSRRSNTYETNDDLNTNNMNKNNQNVPAPGVLLPSLKSLNLF